MALPIVALLDAGNGAPQRLTNHCRQWTVATHMTIGYGGVPKRLPRGETDNRVQCHSEVFFRLAEILGVQALSSLLIRSPL